MSEVLLYVGIGFVLGTLFGLGWRVAYALCQSAFLSDREWERHAEQRGAC